MGKLKWFYWCKREWFIANWTEHFTQDDIDPGYNKGEARGKITETQ